MSGCSSEHWSIQAHHRSTEMQEPCTLCWKKVLLMLRFLSQESYKEEAWGIVGVLSVDGALLSWLHRRTYSCCISFGCCLKWHNVYNLVLLWSFLCTPIDMMWWEHCPGLTTGIVMPQLHASAALLSRCEDRSQLSTIANPNSHKHNIASSSSPSHKSKPPTAHKESERFRSTPQNLPYPPGDE